ncbi:acetyltransferase [Coemansia javaensis]|uniref:Acetyltransferase n=1 Tax=Coemansia javaensis TaxID=2761396 RepID=A0A9W8HHI3_9FUNG|nr:acetyltransferase [Coemansia javaensis]
MGDAPPRIRIAPAEERDVGLVLQLIRELAAYERAADQVEATEELLRRNLFGPRPYAEAAIAYVDRGAGEQPAGLALFFHNFSTWTGRPGLYLEDLFVRPEFRGLGVGRMLLVQLARIARDRECGRMEWVVLDWNEPSIRFYLGLGAQQMKDWIIHRVSGPTLDRLAALE